jgi:hypothetical protein
MSVVAAFLYEQVVTLLGPKFPLPGHAKAIDASVWPNITINNTNMQRY